MKRTNFRMGDAQELMNSAWEAGQRSAIGDGEGVGEPATERVDVIKSSEKHPAIDSRTTTPLDAPCGKSGDSQLQTINKHIIKDLPSTKISYRQFKVSPKMASNDPDKHSSKARDHLAEEHAKSDVGPEEIRAREKVPPRKSFSLEKDVGNEERFPRKALSMLSSFLPSFVGRREICKSSPADPKLAPVGECGSSETSKANRKNVVRDEDRSKLAPIRSISLQNTRGEKCETLMTSSLTTLKTQAEESARKCSSTKSLCVEKLSAFDRKYSNKIIPVETTRQDLSAEKSLLARGSDVFPRAAVIPKVEGDLVEDILDNAETTSVDDADLKPDASAEKSTVAEGDELLEEFPLLEQSSSQKELKPQLSQQSVVTPSLQSTCDVSSWSWCHYHSLPQWMQDNEFILSCHRPPLPSFFACFKSIFRLHTETLNIWTHLIGCVAFVAMGTYFLALPREAVWLQEKLAFGAFFGGGAACFALSSAYHTLWCHSPAVGRLFSKLDYCGIALLIMGSFVPWLYYAFYCRGRLLLGYLVLVIALGALAVLVSLWGRFGEPRFRPLRAGVFLAYGLSGIVPALHFAAAEGWRRAVGQASLPWLALMGALYVTGACVYAMRVPERFFPGRCDLLFQSHQIFHVFVIAAALVHYHGLTQMAVYRLTFTDCTSRAIA